MMIQDNLPPPPPSFDKPEPPTRTHILFALRGNEWLEIGWATRSADGKGLRITHHIGVEDGEELELRAVDPAYYPAAEKSQRKKTPSPKATSTPKTALAPRAKTRRW
jgi:hypothetical protein